MQKICPNCSAQIREGAKFCANCGSPVAKPKPTRCPNPQCVAPLDGTELFCSACGQKIESATSADSKGRVSCVACRHFRRVIPISTLLRAPGRNAKEAITKISEDETKIRDAEAKQKVELIKIGCVEWGLEPVMSEHCAAHMNKNIFEIHELKNRNEDCVDFLVKPRGTGHNCFSCKWRVPHGDPYSRLDNITDNKIFSSMSENIDAEIGLEVTSIYHNKGTFSNIPQAHDWCNYYSNTEGRNYAAIPYFNRHNDCPKYRSNVEQPIALSPQSESSLGESEKLGNTHEIVIEIISEIIAAMRSTYQDNPSALAEVITCRLRALDNQELHEQLENYVIFIVNAKLDDPTSSSVFEKVADQIFSSLSDRARSIMQKPPEAAFFKSLKTNPFFDRGEYIILGQPSIIQADALADICEQTVCEAFWFDQLGTEARKQFLSDEWTRVRSGMYPQEVVGQIERTLEDLEHAISKYGVSSQEDDFWAACVYISPLSNPQMVQFFGELCAKAGCSNIFPAQPFDSWQRQVMSSLVSGTYNLEEAVRFLANRHHALLDIIQTFWAVGDRADVPFDLSPYSKLIPAIFPVYIAHHFVTEVLNRYSRRLRGAQHVDYPHARPSIITVGIEQDFKKLDPTFAVAMAPKRQSLQRLAHSGLVELGSIPAPAPAQAPAPAPAPAPAMQPVGAMNPEDADRILDEVDAAYPDGLPITEISTDVPATIPASSIASKVSTEVRNSLQNLYDQLVSETSSKKRATEEFVLRGVVTGMVKENILDLGMAPQELVHASFEDLVHRLSEVGLLTLQRQK